MIDCILRKGDIPHNKFMVLSENGKPTMVLSGSTNWTSTGLCTQTNNALVIESPAVAERYIAYWNTLKADVDAAGGDQKKLQSPKQRAWDHNNNESSISKPIDLGGGVTVEPMFSPNTNHVLASPPKETPNDMSRVFELIAAPNRRCCSSPSIPATIRSSTPPAGRWRKIPTCSCVARSPARSVPASSRRPCTRAARPTSTSGPQALPSSANPASRRRRAPRPRRSISARFPPARSPPRIPSAIGKAELAKYGFAIIHNKIVVIDPFSDNCTVITGSHNLGFRASHNNDENMVIVRGHRKLAEAYACHVLDIYDHYAWRYWLKLHPDIFGKSLAEDDKWQERYIVGPDEKSPELRFWLSASAGGASGPAPKASAAPAASSAKSGASTPGRTKSASSNNKKSEVKPSARKKPPKRAPGKSKKRKKKKAASKKKKI